MKKLLKLTFSLIIPIVIIDTKRHFISFLLCSLSIHIFIKKKAHSIATNPINDGLKKVIIKINITDNIPY